MASLKHAKRIGSSVGAFTLVEIMVSVTLLVLLVVIIGQMYGSAMLSIVLTDKHLDGDAQARAVFDRMEVDFGQILKRPDIDYFLKDDVNKMLPGNDQLAVYSQVPGYSSSTQLSPVSLVAYRINSTSSSPYYNQLERLGYGLNWNGVIFTNTPTSSLPNTIYTNWPNATTMASDAPYEELIGPGVFRMEYYYVLRGQVIGTTSVPSAPSILPWSASAGHSSICGLRDVAAITVVLAVIDPKSQVLVKNSQLIQLAGQMNDITVANSTPGTLEAQWQSAISSATLTCQIPKAAVAGIRVYRRDFYLPQN